MLDVFSSLSYFSEPFSSMMNIFSVSVLYIFCLQQEETISTLEENIRATQDAAIEAADTDSVVTGTSVTGGQEENVGE